MLRLKLSNLRRTLWGNYSRTSQWINKSWRLRRKLIRLLLSKSLKIMKKTGSREPLPTHNSKRKKQRLSVNKWRQPRERSRKDLKKSLLVTLVCRKLWNEWAIRWTTVTKNWWRSKKRITLLLAFRRMKLLTDKTRTGNLLLGRSTMRWLIS